MNSNMKAITGAKLFDGHRFCEEQALLIDDQKIAAICRKNEIPADAESLNFDGCTIAPGLIDLQIYGGGGHLFSAHPHKGALHAIANALVKTGTTGFVITLATNSDEVFMEAVKTVREHPHAAVLGIHFEGPFINPAKKGAHLEEFIKQPDLQDAEELLRKTADVLKIITLAPECCAPGVIELFRDAGVLVSAGHSNATFSQAQQAFRSGIKAVTHLFNAMSPLHHRDTGLPGATYLQEGVRASIIADGIHVDFAAVEISKKLLGDRLFLITDAVEETSEGPYIHVKQSDRFTLPNGTLSGSRLTLLQAVKNCVQKVGIPVEEALRMATLYPSRLLNLEQGGVLHIGNYADVVVFDENFEIKATFLRGRCFH